MDSNNVVVENIHVLHKMRQYGGGFVRALAEAGFNADSQNLAKIKAAWPDLWAEYSAWARASRKMEAETRPESFGDANPPEFERGAI